MLSPCNNPFLGSSNSFPNDVDASSPPSNDANSHTVAPSSQDQLKQPLVDGFRSTINPDISQPSGALFNPVVKTTISHRSLSSQHGIAPVIPTQISATFLADRVSSTINTGDQLATPAAQYPPIPPGPVSTRRPRPAGFVAIPARGDSVNYMWTDNVPGAREAREHIQPRSIGDAKTVLILFNGVFIPIVVSFIIESYQFLSPNIRQNPSPPPAAPIIIVNVLWLISLVLNITLTLFATSALMGQWTRGYTQLPQAPRTSRDHMDSRSYLFLCTLSVFLFLTGLVIFFFIIHKIVGIVVLIVLIAVGLFGIICLVLRPYLYRTLLPLSRSTIRR